MRLYRTSSGEWVGTQAQAGKGFEQIEVPTDKPGLIAWLNEHCATRVPETPAEALSEPENRPSDDVRCPKCQFNRKQAERLARTYADSIGIDALNERIMASEGWMLGQLATAVASRFKELAEART